VIELLRMSFVWPYKSLLNPFLVLLGCGYYFSILRPTSNLFKPIRAPFYPAFANHCFYITPFGISQQILDKCLAFFYIGWLVLLDIQCPILRVHVYCVHCAKSNTVSLPMRYDSLSSAKAFDLSAWLAINALAFSNASVFLFNQGF